MTKPIRYETDFEGNRYPIFCELESIQYSKVVVQTIPTNDNCRMFISRLTMGDGYSNWQRGRGFSSHTDRWAIIELLTEIPGIEAIHASNAYTLMVTKPATWAWEEIEPSVVKILEEFNMVGL